MAPAIDNERLRAAAALLKSMGATGVFVFGSFATGRATESSDVDIAVAGLQARLYFRAAGKAWNLLGRPVDLVDLDDDTPFVRHLLASRELVRVG